MSLGPSTISENGMRVIAVLSPCHLLDGTVLISLPSDGFEIVAAYLIGGEAIDGVVVDKQLLTDLGNGQALYSADLNETMSGTTPNGGNQTTLNDNTNAILLWNNEGEDVEFISDNTLAVNIISHR